MQRDDLQPTQNGTPRFQMDYYEMRVQRNAPGGSLARVEFATGTITANQPDPRVGGER